jgi:sugar phosphate isomerase/epimerase
MSRFGIELASVFGLPPVEHAKLAAELGCSYITTGLNSPPRNPDDYPLWSLRNDATLRRELKAALRDLGVALAIGEGATVLPSVDVGDYAADLDLYAELGAQRIGTRCLDPDLDRSTDQFSRLAEMTAERGFRATTLEYAPYHPLNHLDKATAMIARVGKPNFRLLIDVMHLYRSGSTPQDVAALPPEIIEYVQVCDIRMEPAGDDYLAEATRERLVPGTGEIPLRELLSVIPAHVPLGIEVPMLGMAEAGVSAIDRMRPCVEALNALVPAEQPLS